MSVPQMITTLNKDAKRMQDKRKRIASNETLEERTERLKKLAAQKKELRARYSKKMPDASSIVAVASSSASVPISSNVDTVAKEKESIPEQLQVKCDYTVGRTDETILREIEESQIMQNATKRPTVESLKKYLTAMRSVQKDLIPNSTALQFELFTDHSKVIEAITNSVKRNGETTSLNTRITKVGAIGSILKYYPEYAKVAKSYLETMTDLQEVNTSIRDKNIATTPLVDWIQIRDANFKPKLFNSPMERGLHGLYSLAPIRRLDYRTMTIHLIGSVVLDSGNYLFVNHAGDPILLQFGSFKTIETYGIQKIPVPPELSVILKPYILTLQIGKYLFPTESGKPYTESGFSTLVSELFSRIHGTKLTVNLIRQSVVSHFLSIPNTTMAEKKEFARLMAHSVGVQGLYNKIDTSGSGKKRRGKNSLPSTVFPWIFSPK